MKRRTFLGTSGAVGVMSILPISAMAEEYVEFTESDEIAMALNDGQTVLIVYSANWCATCAAQERALKALRDENPVYDENIVFVRVDWDKFGRKPVTTDRKVPRRSTLVALKGESEIGRLVSGTSRDKIKALLDSAQDAGTS